MKRGLSFLAGLGCLLLGYSAGAAPGTPGPVSGPSEVKSALTALVKADARAYPAPKAATGAGFVLLPLFRAGSGASAPKDAELFILAPLIVHAKELREIPESEIYTSRAFTELLVKRYLTEFDYGVLNHFRLPLFGSEPPEKRAREAYQRDQAREIKDEGRLFREPDFDLKPEAYEVK